MIRETVKLMPGRDEVYLDYYGNDDRSEVANAMLVIPGWRIRRRMLRPRGRADRAVVSYERHKRVCAALLGRQRDKRSVGSIDRSFAGHTAHTRKRPKVQHRSRARICGGLFGRRTSGGFAGHTVERRGASGAPARGGRTEPAHGRGAVLPGDIVQQYRPHGVVFSTFCAVRTPDAAALERFSLEKHVGAHTSPAFIDAHV